MFLSFSLAARRGSHCRREDIWMVDEIITAYYQLDSEFGYDFVYNIDNTPKNDAEFKLHNHDNLYEIDLFLSGNAEFHIEGNIYRAHPHDIFIARPYEMHHNVFLSSDKYERIVIFISLDFSTGTGAVSWRPFSGSVRWAWAARSLRKLWTGKCTSCL